MKSTRIDRERVTAVVLGMLAAEQYCTRETLLDGDVHVVEAEPGPPAGGWIPGGRWFERCEPYFSIVTVGVGGVVTASPELMPWVRPLFEGVDRDQMMEPARIAQASTRMERHGQKSFGPFPRWVCSEDDLRPQPVPAGFAVELRPAGDADAQEQDGRRPGERTPRRFRAVAIGPQGAVGAATASEDSDDLYQIGIAIAEEYRGRGLGRALTCEVTRAIFERGAVPYYGTTSVNTWSMRTAIACGFYPAWVHFFSRDVRPS